MEPSRAIARTFGRRRAGDPVAPEIVILKIPNPPDSEPRGVESVVSDLLHVRVPGWSWRIDESAEAASGLLAAVRSAGIVPGPASTWVGAHRGMLRMPFWTLVAVRFERA